MEDIRYLKQFHDCRPIRGRRRSGRPLKKLSSVGIGLGYGLDDRGLGFDSRRGLGICLFTTTSRTALRPTQPPIQWVPGVLSLGVKRPGREAKHWPPSSAEVKNEWSYTSTIRYTSIAWCSVKAQGQLYLRYLR
jgi:hypothetical protein